MNNVKVIIIKETWQESLISDFITFIMAFLLIGVGVYFVSPAMQWVGFIVFIIFVLTRVIFVSKKRAKTIPEARELLDKLDNNSV